MNPLSAASRAIGLMAAIVLPFTACTSPAAPSPLLARVDRNAREGVARTDRSRLGCLFRPEGPRVLRND
jgi:hypothetical protein